MRFELGCLAVLVSGLEVACDAATSDSTYLPYETTVEPSGTDREAVQQAIEQMKATPGGGTVRLLGRTYVFDCDAGRRASGYCLEIGGATGLRLEGVPGQTRILIRSPRAGGIFIVDSVDVQISGIEIDYDPPPFTQGTIVEAGPDALSYAVDPGYPALDHPMFTEDRPSFHQGWVGFVHRPGSFVMKGAEGSYFWGTGQNEDLGGGVWRVHGVGHGFSNEPIAVGDGFSLGPRTYFAAYSLRSKDVAFRDVRVTTAPSIAFALVSNTGELTLERVTVDLTSASGRKLSSVADAIHAQNNSALLRVDGGQFAAMGDDIFNSYTIGLGVGSVSGSQIQLPRADPPIAMNDSLQFVSADGRQNKGTATVTEVTLTADSQLVSLAALPPGIAAGDIAFDIHHASPGAMLTRNTVGSFRGLIRLRSPLAQLVANSFADPRNARVLVSVDSAWANEGPMAAIPFFAANDVTNGSLRFLGLDFAPIADPRADFFQPPGPGIYHSNGVDAYCVFRQWGDFLAAGGLPDLSNVHQVMMPPPVLVDAGPCP